MKENIDDLMTNQRHILEAIKYLKEQVEDIVKKDKVMNEKDVDVDRILESQAMIDELLVKNCDDILRIKKMKEENADNIKVLDKKIDKIDKKINKEKDKIEMNMDRVRNVSKSSNFGKLLNCNLCENTFCRFVDLETHIRTCHENHEMFTCEQCDKGFVLKWRLKKHMRIHSDRRIKHCHYFNNGKACPFYEIGCKFLHALSNTCKSGEDCDRRLCPYRHDKSNAENINDDEMKSEMSAHENSSKDNDSFATSTPLKENCGECSDEANCTYCFVLQYSRRKRVHFSGAL